MKERMPRRTAPGFWATLLIVLGAAWIGMACNAITEMGRHDGSSVGAATSSSNVSSSASSSGPTGDFCGGP
jgi:hypothetical protein